jgi:hypothetical protein
MCPDRQSYDEKRDFLRIPVDCELKLETVPDGRSFNATGRNLSAGGVLFHTEELLQTGDRLEMHIGSGQPLFPDLDATIEVVRVEPLSDSGRYAIGSAIRTIHKRTS